jgi:hypothetical protein
MDLERINLSMRSREEIMEGDAFEFQHEKTCIGLLLFVGFRLVRTDHP